MKMSIAFSPVKTRCSFALHQTINAVASGTPFPYFVPNQTSECNSPSPINVHQITPSIPNLQPLPYIHPRRHVFPDQIFLQPNQSVTLHHVPTNQPHPIFAAICTSNHIGISPTHCKFYKIIQRILEVFLFLIFIKYVGLLATKNPVRIWCVYISIMQLFSVYCFNTFWLYIAVFERRWSLRMGIMGTNYVTVGKPKTILTYGTMKSLPPPSYSWSNGSDLIGTSRRICMDEHGKT